MDPSYFGTVNRGRQITPKPVIGWRFLHKPAAFARNPRRDAAPSALLTPIGALGCITGS
jgi:hypothetical protein